MISPWKQKLSYMIPMRDGVRLSCDIRFPKGEGRFPVVLFRTPYNKARDLLDPEVTRWTDQGYVFVAQDCRGRHESEGHFEPMIQDAADGVDTIQWIREQPFCNGQVCMTGASYCGWTQLAAASSNPAGLEAILPQVMTTEKMDSRTSFGGIKGMLNVWWLLLNTNRSQMADPVGDWDSFLAQLPVNRLDETLGFHPIPAFRKALDPQMSADMWENHSILQGLDSCDVPICLGVGWFDVFSGGAMRDASRLIALRKGQGQDDFRVIAGPWGHGLCEKTECGELDFGSDSLIDLMGLQNAFVAHQLKGTPLPEELGKSVLYFLMGTNVWKQADNWPPSECVEKTFFLDSEGKANSHLGDGQLSAESPNCSGSDHYICNPLDPVPSIGGASLFLHAPAGPMDQRPAEERDDVLCYTSEELDKAVTIVGIPRAEIFVETSAVDTDFFVRICDVYPDGRSMLVTDGGMRMAHREEMASPVPVIPGECYKLEIDLTSTAMCFLPGHRLRIEITSSCFPRFIRNLNSAKDPTEEIESDAVIARQIVHHSTDRLSRLILPILDS